MLHNISLPDFLWSTPLAKDKQIHQKKTKKYGATVPLRPAHVRPDLEATLRDLQLDYVDSYVIHWPMAVPSTGNNQYLHFLKKSLNSKLINIYMLCFKKLISDMWLFSKVINFLDTKLNLSLS